MIGTDLLQVITAPHKAFKRIVENPKYLGAILVIILFVALQMGFEYIQFSKTYSEQTQPVINALGNYTTASNGYWMAGSNVSIADNYSDYFNYTVYTVYGYYPNLFGNSSLQISGVNTNNIQAALTNVSDGLTSISNVDCSEVGFQNLSMTIKLVEPQTAPQNATLTMFSLNSDTDFYQYNLTPSLSNLAAGQWNNLTVPVGKAAAGWTPTGAPSWSNVTSLTLGLSYPENSNITIRIGALYFRGEFQTPVQQSNTGFLLYFLQRFPLQILFSWFLITGLIYLLLKAVKTDIVWKPLFIAVGFALFVLVIRGLVNIILAATLPAIYYPFDVLYGITPWGTAFYPADQASTLSAQSQAAAASIGASTGFFNLATSIIFVISYIWLGLLCTLILGALKPELSIGKRAVISAASIVVTVLVLIFFIVGIA